MADVLTALILGAIVLVDVYLRDRQRRWIQREIDHLKARDEHLHGHAKATDEAIERFERHLAHNDGVMDRLRTQVNHKSSTKKGSS